MTFPMQSSLMGLENVERKDFHCTTFYSVFNPTSPVVLQLNTATRVTLTRTQRVMHSFPWVPVLPLLMSTVIFQPVL